MPRKKKNTPSFTDPVTAADLDRLARWTEGRIETTFETLSYFLRMTDEGLAELLAHVCALLEKGGCIERQQLVELAQKLEKQGQFLVHMQNAFTVFQPDDAVSRIGQTVVRLETLAASIARINDNQSKMPDQQVE